MKRFAVAILVPLLVLVGCTATLEVSDVDTSITTRGQAVNVNQEFEISLGARVGESKAQVPYRINIVASKDGGAPEELFSTEAIGDFSDTVVLTLSEPGVWELQSRVENLESVEPVAESALAVIAAFRSSEVTLSLGNIPSVWLTNQLLELPFDFSIRNQIDDLAIKLEERKEGSWIEIESIGGVEQPVFQLLNEGERIGNYRLSAYSDKILLAHSPEVDIEFFTPDRMIRDLYYRLTQASTAAEQFDITAEDTYPGLQFPTERDRARYARYDPYTSIVPLLETLDTSPNWVLKWDLPCVPNALPSEPLPGIHFVHDILEDGLRFTVHASFLDGKMYYHRGLCW